MYITSNFIKEKYPKCKLLVSEVPMIAINNKPYFAKTIEFSSIEEFEKEFYDALIAGVGYLFMVDNEDSRKINEHVSSTHDKIIRLF